MLTKSDYLKYLQCEKYLWLYKKHKELLPLEEADQWSAITGAQVEEQAYRLFPEGQAVEAPSFPEMKQQTIRLMSAFTPVIFQAVVSSPRLFCRSDILRFDSLTQAWDIIEVKSATSIKDVYLDDLALQRLCLAEAGYRVGKTLVIHIDNSYVRQGEIEPSKLLKTVDLTSEIEEIIAETELEIARAEKVLRFSFEPSVRIIGQCYDPYDCPFISYCHQDFPEHSIYSIAGALGEKKMEQLLDEGIIAIADIPYEYLDKEKLLKHCQAVRHDIVHIETEGIAQELSKLEYPLYFLDYETYSPAIPLFDGYRPYQRVVFQYSLHIKESPQSELRHEYFLAREASDPTWDLSATLAERIGSRGTVIAWNMGFEKGCNTEMAERASEFQAFYQDVNERMYDLMQIFRQGFYVHKDFHGSASIKKVLPVLAPDLDYHALAIGEGLTASNRWGEMVTSAMSQEEKDKIYQDLLAYCELDTLAMVRILEALKLHLP